MWPVAAMIALAFMGSMIVSPLYTLYQHEFGFSNITLTLVYAVYVLGNLAALLLFGGISDRVGRRRVGLAATGLAASSGMLFLFAGSTTWLFWARMLTGLAVGLASGTGSAWLAELVPNRDRARASLIATIANFVGLSIGSLLAGCLAEYSPWPLQLPFIVYIVALGVLAIGIRTTQETVRPQTDTRFEFHVQLAIPRAIRTRFIAPAVCGFGTFSLIGFYAALAPSLLKERVHIDSPAMSGVVLGELFLVSAVATYWTRKVAGSRAMLAGLALLVPSVALLLLADIRGSLPLLFLDSALTGLSAALGYRGSLQATNEMAPAQQRAEVVSSYFLACFIGNSVPVIGVGFAAAAWGPIVAVTVFAALLVVFTVAALAAGFKYRAA